MEYGDYTLTGTFYFNEDDELVNYWFEPPSDEGMTYAEFDEFLDLVSEDVDCNPKVDHDKALTYMNIYSFEVSDSIKLFVLYFDYGYDDKNYVKVYFGS